MSLSRILSILCMLFISSLSLQACGPPPPPEPPTNIKTDQTKNRDGVIELSFQLEEKFEGKVVKFKVYRDAEAAGKFQEVLAEIEQTKFASQDENSKIFTYIVVDTKVMPGGKYNTPFYYRIASIDKDGQEGPKSDPIKAQTENAKPPMDITDITVEGNNLVGASPEITIRWKGNTEYDIKGYYIYRSEQDKPIVAKDIKDARNSNKIISHVPGKKEYGWTDTDIKEGDLYYYIVVAVDFDDVIGQSSFTNRFLGLVLGKAVLLTPDDGASVANPSFKWEPVTSAAGYVVVVQRSPTGGPVWRSKYVETPEVTYDGSELSSNTSYWWKVLAFTKKPTDPANELGNSESELRKFKFE